MGINFSGNQKIVCVMIDDGRSFDGIDELIHGGTSATDEYEMNTPFSRYTYSFDVNGVRMYGRFDGG